MYSLYQACWLLAVQMTTTPGAETTTPAANGGEAVKEAANDGGLFGSLFTFLPLMLCVMVIYFLLMPKPGAKENAKTKQMMDNLKKNDCIVTAGGIMGTVVGIRSESDYLTIKIDESTNTKMKILKQSVIRVLKDDEKDV